MKNKNFIIIVLICINIFQFVFYSYKIKNVLKNVQKMSYTRGVIDASYSTKAIIATMIESDYDTLNKKLFVVKMVIRGIMEMYNKLDEKEKNLRGCQQLITNLKLYNNKFKQKYGKLWTEATLDNAEKYFEAEKKEDK